MRLITTNCWLFNLDFRCKTPLGSWFLEFFDSKKMPSLWAFYWCWKNFHLIISSMWSQWTSNFELRNLSQSTSFVRPGMKVTVCGQLKLFNFEHKNVEFLDEIFVLNHPKIFRFSTSVHTDQFWVVNFIFASTMSRLRFL